MAQCECRQRLFLVIEVEASVGFKTQHSLVVIAAKVGTSETAAGAYLPVTLGAGHVYHLLDQ